MKLHDTEQPQLCQCVDCLRRRNLSLVPLPKKKRDGASLLEVLAYIGAYQAENQCPPTQREIQEHFGWKSPRAATYHVNKLLAQGKLFRRHAGTKASRDLFVTQPTT